MKITRAERAAEIEDRILRRMKKERRPLSGFELHIPGAGSAEMVRALRALVRIGLLDKRWIVKDGKRRPAWELVDLEKEQQWLDRKRLQR